MYILLANMKAMVIPEFFFHNLTQYEFFFHGNWIVFVFLKVTPIKKLLQSHHGGFDSPLIGEIGIKCVFN